MPDPRCRVVEARAYGGPDVLRVVETPLPGPAAGEVRIRVLASAIEYTDTLIRRRLYPQTTTLRPPYVPGYGVVGEIDQLGEGVEDFALGDRVADMTVTGSNATWRTLRAARVTRVPAGVDPAEVAALVLSWMTAYQLLHRAAKVRAGQRVLVHGAAGAVGQALLVLGKLAGLELWGGADGRHASLIRDLGATPVDYGREDFASVLPGGFDVVFDGIGESGYRNSFRALAPKGRLCAFGYSAGVRAGRHMAVIMLWIGRLYLWDWWPDGRRAGFFSINAMQASHPEWFREDLERLFGLLASGDIRPRVEERISLEEVAEAHRRLEAGGLEGKLVLCPDLPPRSG